jgi:hypothetical protein
MMKNNLAIKKSDKGARCTRVPLKDPKAPACSFPYRRATQVANGKKENKEKTPNPI